MLPLTVLCTGWEAGISGWKDGLEAARFFAVNRAPEKTRARAKVSWGPLGKEEWHVGRVSAGFKPGSLALQAESLPAELPGKPGTDQEAPKK